MDARLVQPDVRQEVRTFGAGVLFPLSLLLARLRGLDTSAQGNPLGVLAGLLGAVQILYIPVLLGAYYLAPDAVPWFLGALVGAHLLPFGWLYGGAGYLLAAVGTTAAAGLTGRLPLDGTYVSTPFAVAAVLAAPTMLLLRESRADHQLLEELWSPSDSRSRGEPPQLPVERADSR